MEDSSNPLRHLILSGQAKVDFHQWYQTTYQNRASDIECWNYHTQREYYEKFFNAPIRDSNDFYSELEKYNSKI